MPASWSALYRQVVAFLALYYFVPETSFPVECFVAAKCWSSPTSKTCFCYQPGSIVFVHSQTVESVTQVLLRVVSLLFQTLPGIYADKVRKDKKYVRL